MRAFAAPLIAAVLAASTLAIAPAAQAASLEIGPVNVSLIGRERTATVQVRNPGTEPLNVQIRPVDWTQADGQDVHTPSETLVVSPPFFTVAPGQAQTVRLVVNLPKTPTTERAWRLIIDELPPAKAGGVAGVVVPIRALVPVFLAPSLAARPKLAWSATSQDGQLRLNVANSGPVHERLIGLQLTSGGKPVGGPDPLFGYVLSGTSRTWSVPAAGAEGAVSLRGDGAFGPVKADVAVAN
ncbi:molecular chaperone [Phenylobacterium sp. J367]|uniref:fimbrial biogenesis chaperone n=1 Tax=Phenylobacterium sp. J367 TaxID=2898435 RepID=UPI002151DCDA|nr:molecular chaperone [Phenylobacterium sp. J367]MCR5877509.1 molecular chaperone [Phenylobacterium sp. J367]